MKTTGAFSVAAVLAAAALFITPQASQAMTLDEAVRMALQNNHSVKAAKSRKEAAEYGSSAAVSGFLPSVEVGETYSKTDNPMYAFGTKLNQERITQGDFDPAALNNPEAVENWKTTVSVRQPIFAGGRIWNEYGKAKAGENMAAAGYAGVKRAITYKVIESWLNIRQLEKSLEALNVSSQLVGESLKVAKDRVDAGMALQSDLLDMQINFDRVRKEIVATEGALKTAKSAFKTLVGMEQAAKIDFQFGEYTVPIETPEIDGAVKNGLESRTDVGQAKAAAEMARRDYGAAKGGFLPSIGIAADYDWNRSDFSGKAGQSYMVAVEAKWNIFSGGRDRARLMAARAALDAARNDEKLVSESIRNDIERNINDFKTAMESTAISGRGVQFAEESHRIIKQQYMEGLKSAADLLSSETQLEKARLANIAAESEALLARARVDFSMGLDETTIKENAK